MKFQLTLALILCAWSSSAQRYLDEIFLDVQVETDVVFGENYTVMLGYPPSLEDLKMDVYTPVGDTATDRYLILLAHSGSWFPKGVNSLPFGNKSDTSMVHLCTQFAKRGWVAASIDYRLGWNPTPDILGGSQEERARTIIQAVYRTMQDMKTAIRFFKKEALEGNAYGIDPTKVVAGGTGSGAYAAVACGSLDRVSELNLFKLLANNGSPYVSIDTLGDFEGFGGLAGWNQENHSGFDSDIRLVLNMEGAVGDSSWIESGEPPVVNFSGVDDPLVVYKTKTGVVVSTGDPIIEISGSYVIAKEHTRLGNTAVWDTVNWTDPYSLHAQSLEPYEGLFPFLGRENAYEAWAWYDPNDPYTVDSVELSPGNWVAGTGYGSVNNPFASREKGMRYLDTIMNYFNPRAVRVMESEPVSKAEVESKAEFRVFRQQDATHLVSTSQGAIECIEIWSIDGRLVRRAIVRDVGFTINQELKGLYVVRAQIGDEIISRKLLLGEM